MTAALAATTPAITDETLTERFHGYIEKGWTPYLAAEAAVRELCQEGHQEALMADVLPALLFKRWEGEHSRTPTQAARDLSRATLEAAAGRRRIDPDVLKRSDSLMESLFCVGDAWVRIGDMDRNACRIAAREQKRAALQRAHYARFFHALAASIPDGSTVRAELFETDLTRIFDEAAPR